MRAIGEATLFVEGSEGPIQVVEALLDWAMPVVDLGAAADPHAAAWSWMSADVDRPMDLSLGPLFSFALIKLGPERFYWYQGYHHIVMDTFGIGLVERRVAETYTALTHGQVWEQDRFGSLRELLDSDSSYRASPQFAQDRAYWAGRFADRPEPTRFVDRSSRTPPLSAGLVGDMSLLVWDRRDGSAPRICWDADPEVCGSDELAAHQQRFLRLLHEIAVADPGPPVGGIDILAPRSVTGCWSSTTTPPSRWPGRGGDNG